MDCSTPGFPVHPTNSWNLLKLMSIESVMPTNYLILSHPLLVLSSIFPRIRVFSNQSVLCIRWPNSKTGVSASASVLPMTDSGLISFRTDWLDLLAVQGTLKSLLQHHSSKASILWRYSCLENPMDGGAWKAAVHGVAEDRTRLSNFTFTFHFHALEKEMATHSSVLAWRIPGTGEPRGLPSVGLHRVGHD